MRIWGRSKGPFVLRLLFLPFSERLLLRKTHFQCSENRVWKEHVGTLRDTLPWNMHQSCLLLHTMMATGLIFDISCSAKKKRLCSQDKADAIGFLAGLPSSEAWLDSQLNWTRAAICLSLNFKSRLCGGKNQLIA